MTDISNRKAIYILSVFNVVYFCYSFWVNSIVPAALDNALVVSGEIVYSRFTAFELYYRNSINLPTQLASLMILSGLSFRLISILIIFGPVLVFCFLSYFISRLFVSNISATIVSIVHSFVGVLAIVTKDYHVHVWTDATFGAWGGVFMLIPLCFLAYGKSSLSVLVSLLLISVHPVTGAFIFGFVLIYLFYTKQLVSKAVLFSLIWGSVGLCIILVKYFVVDRVDAVSEVDQEALQLYREFWQTHRSAETSGKIIFLYGFIIMVTYGLIYARGLRLDIYTANFIKVFSFFSFCGLFLYALKPLYPAAVIDLMPGRFLAPLSLFLTFTILAIFISVLEKLKRVKLFIAAILGIFVLQTSLLWGITTVRPHSHIDDFFHSVYQDSEAKVLSARELRSFPFNEIGPAGIDSTIVVPAPSVARASMYHFRLAPLIMPESFDIVNYHPSTAFEIKEIISQVYGVDYRSPPTRFSGSLGDDDIRSVFVSREFHEWSALSRDFAFCYVSTPDSWELQLPKLSTYQGVSLYFTCDPGVMTSLFLRSD